MRTIHGTLQIWSDSSRMPEKAILHLLTRSHPVPAVVAVEVAVAAVAVQRECDHSWGNTFPKNVNYFISIKASANALPIWPKNFADPQ